LVEEDTGRYCYTDLHPLACGRSRAGTGRGFTKFNTVSNAGCAAGTRRVAIGSFRARQGQQRCPCH
jgi:hypothetical protein